MIQIEPERVCEINNFGRFYVLGKPPFIVLPVFDPFEKKDAGFLLIEENNPSFSSNPYELNCLLRMMEKQLVPVLFKDEEMANHVCKAINRMKL